MEPKEIAKRINEFEQRLSQLSKANENKLVFEQLENLGYIGSNDFLIHELDRKSVVDGLLNSFKIRRDEVIVEYKDFLAEHLVKSV